MDTRNGIVSTWNEEKGFGFITPTRDAKKIFFHIKDFSDLHKRPVVNLKVRFSASRDSDGRQCAVNVIPLKGHKKLRKTTWQRSYSLLIAGVFSCILFYLCDSRVLPVEIAGLYGTMSFLTATIYVKDKKAALSGQWRTPENKLHALSLFFGWPGAMLAQSFLRHKSSKTSFRIIYWLTIIANCSFLYWLVTLDGRLWIRALLRQVYGFARVFS